MKTENMKTMRRKVIEEGRSERDAAKAASTQSESLSVLSSQLDDLQTQAELTSEVIEDKGNQVIDALNRVDQSIIDTTAGAELTAEASERTTEAVKQQTEVSNKISDKLSKLTELLNERLSAITTQNEFAPFGRPLLINSLSLFREYKSALNLQAMARVAKLPKEVFEVTVTEGMTPVEKLAVANEARQEFLNLVDYNNGREEYGVGSSIWTVSGCIEYKLLQNTIDIEDMDPTSVKEELIASTLIPKCYLS